MVKLKHNLEQLKYRGDGWPSGIIVILKSGERKYLPMLGTWWSEIFGGYYFSNYYCTLCTDLFAEMSDISFADAYLPDIIKTDKNGTSIAITRTTVGDRLLKTVAIDKAIEISDLSPGAALRSQKAMLLFKKRNISARAAYLTIFGKLVPKNIRLNQNKFLRPTLLDYFAAPTVYVNIFISKNRVLKRFLKYIPFTFLVLYRKAFKLLLAPHIKSQRRDES